MPPYARIFRRPRSPLLLLAVISAWGALAGGGLVALARYAAAPGLSARPSGDWPANSALQLNKNGPTLVLALHPHCPCSRATLGELSRVLTSASNRPRVYALIVIPSGAAADFDNTDLVVSARAMPNASVIPDQDGSISARFGALTSGQIFAYDLRGRLLFSGGITPSRGHMGDSTGGDALREVLRTGQANHLQSPVFGCPLNTPQCHTRSSS